jgi:lipoyl(octanoyl) transferase
MIIRSLERRDYLDCLQAMRSYTQTRSESSDDQIWLVEHEQVFTLGLASKPEHIFDLGEIPCVQTERGGQVTYHGPGQVVAYLLLDLRRSGLMVRDLVCRMESAIIETLSLYSLNGVRRTNAPGVYLESQSDVGRPKNSGSGSEQTLFTEKIASLGIKVSRGCTYHGLALNVDMCLEPFARINPCGLPGQKITDLRSAIEMERSGRSQNDVSKQSPKKIFAENGEYSHTQIDLERQPLETKNGAALLLEVSEHLGLALKRQLTAQR